MAKVLIVWLIAWPTFASPVSEVAQVDRQRAPVDGPVLAFSASIDGSRAIVSYESHLSRGLAGEGLVQLHIPIGNWRLSPALGYQHLWITRELTGSGTLEDSNPTPVTQSIGFLTAQFLVSRRFQLEDRKPLLSDNIYWFEAGAEYLSPVVSSQTIRSLDAESFANTDRPLLALLGVSADVQWSASLLLTCRLQAFYNVFGAAGSHYLGARLAVALGVAL